MSLLMKPKGQLFPADEDRRGKRRAPFLATHRLSKVSAGGCTLRATAAQLPSNLLTILLVHGIIIFTKLKTVGVCRVRTSDA